MTIAWRVLICDSIDKVGIEILTKAGLTVDYQPDITLEKLLSDVGGYDALVVRSRTNVSKDVIENGNSLKVIARVGVGLDNIDTDYAERKNIKVINAQEAAINAVSELVIGFMISLARQIPYAHSELSKGNWVKKSVIGTELSGKYLGIVGVGNIGRNVGRIARALRMNIIGYDIFPISREYISEVSMINTDLNTLVESSDFITVHVPLSSDTYHLFDGKLLSRMKKSGYIINSSRGGIVDESALYDLLKDQKIAGAGLDVFEFEPPTNKKLLELPNVLCTPHIGAQTREAQELAARVIAEKLIHRFQEMSV
ncbi:MAG TPA: D-2-hydroxyacid dehydrogenase [Nitrososphaeraceae archaeon]|jgi:D-3-phosphoglycerate dehydrogenase|nr:D-2-hydroxyacid dehydrogenase [Nitrososphaeraceae archaeon]